MKHNFKKISGGDLNNNNNQDLEGGFSLTRLFKFLVTSSLGVSLPFVSVLGKISNFKLKLSSSGFPIILRFDILSGLIFNLIEISCLILFNFSGKI